MGYSKSIILKPTYECVRASSSVDFTVVAPFSTTLERFAACSWSARRCLCGEAVDASGALCLARQSVGVRQLVERVVATAPFPVLLGRQRKHVAPHGQDVTHVDLPRRLLCPRSSPAVSGCRRRRRRLAGVGVAVVGRVRLNVAVDVGQQQPLVGDGPQSSDDQRLQRILASTTAGRRRRRNARLAARRLRVRHVRASRRATALDL